MTGAVDRRFADFDPDVVSSSPNGILKGIYIRGLTEARMRNPGTDLGRYIEAYITVQVSCDPSVHVCVHDRQLTLHSTTPSWTSLEDQRRMTAIIQGHGSGHPQRECAQLMAGSSANPPIDHSKLVVISRLWMS